VLFDDVIARQDDQGLRELVALVGMTHAHQRVSGEIKQTDDQRSGRSKSTDSTVGLGIDTSQLLKPAVPLVAGAAAAAATFAIAASSSLAIAIGLLSTLGASWFAKFTSSSSNRRQRELTQTFLPDLSVTTLDRMLPMLMDRLNRAGLAPVFIIDELDKIPDLFTNMDPLVNNLKKLFAESALTCLLVDRKFFEELRASNRDGLFDRHHSYFSYRLYVFLQPRELHEFLGKVLDIEPGGTAASIARDKLDLDVLKWVLLHRSRLNGLSLSRQLEGLRLGESALRLDPGLMRSNVVYRTDLTLQVAIQLCLASEKTVQWMERNAFLTATLFDALYYLTHLWSIDADAVDLSDGGRAGFADYLADRMRSDEAPARSGAAPTPTPGREADGETAPAPAARGVSSTGARFLSENEIDELYEVARAVGALLRDTASAETLREGFADVDDTRYLVPELPILDAVLTGDCSVLVPHPDGKVDRFWWRMRRDAQERRQGAPSLVDAMREPVTYLEATETMLWTVLRQRSDPASPHGRAFAFLADETRLLPTTPASAQVQGAIGSFRLVERGERVGVPLDGDLAILRQYKALLEDNLDTVRLALIIAAFLGRLAAPDTDANANADAHIGAAQMSSASFPVTHSDRVRAGLATLSRVMRFPRTDILSIAITLGDVVRGLQALPPLSAYLPSTQGSLPDRVSEWDAAAQRFAREAPWARLRGAALEGWRLRCLLTIQTSQERTPGLHELLCSAHGGERERVLGRDFDDMTLRRWSRVFQASLPKAMGAGNQDAGLPAWAAVIALRQLGAGNLNEGVKSLLARAVTQEAPDDPAASQLLSDNQLWAGSSKRRDIVLVARLGGHSVTASWRQPPTLGLIVMLPLADIDLLLNSPLTALLRSALATEVPGVAATDARVRLCIEQPSDNAAIAVAAALEKRARGDGIETLRIIRSGEAPPDVAHVVQPRGPDDLFYTS
jgi:hypothetical protein